MVENVDAKEITAMVSDLNLGMIQEVHMTNIATSNDLWHDSGATTHVCNNKAFFKDYEESVEGHEVVMGDHQTSKVLGSGKFELQLISEKKSALNSVLYVPTIR